MNDPLITTEQIAEQAQKFQQKFNIVKDVLPGDARTEDILRVLHELHVAAHQESIAQAASSQSTEPVHVSYG